MDVLRHFPIGGYGALGLWYGETRAELTHQSVELLDLCPHPMHEATPISIRVRFTIPDQMAKLVAKTFRDSFRSRDTQIGLVYRSSDSHWSLIAREVTMSEFSEQFTENAHIASPEFSLIGCEIEFRDPAGAPDRFGDWRSIWREPELTADSIRKLRGLTDLLAGRKSRS